MNARLRPQWILVLSSIFTASLSVHGQDFPESRSFTAAELEHQYGTVLVQILSTPKFRERYDIIDSQLVQIRELQRRAQESFSAEFRRIHEELRKVENENWEEQVAQATSRMQQQIDAGLEDILLPFQIEELKRTMRWLLIERIGRYSAIFEFQQIQDVLNLDASQATQLSEKAEALQLEFEADLQKLKQKYRDKLNQSLSPAQRERLRELLGEPEKFDLPLASPTIYF